MVWFRGCLWLNEINNSDYNDDAAVDVDSVDNDDLDKTCSCVLPIPICALRII